MDGMAVATIDDSTDTMKIAMQQPLTTQRRLAADKACGAAASVESGTGRTHWRFPRER